MHACMQTWWNRKWTVNKMHTWTKKNLFKSKKTKVWTYMDKKQHETKPNQSVTIKTKRTKQNKRHIKILNTWLRVILQLFCLVTDLKILAGRFDWTPVRGHIWGRVDWLRSTLPQRKGKWRDLSAPEPGRSVRHNLGLWRGVRRLRGHGWRGFGGFGGSGPFWRSVQVDLHGY